MKFDLPIQLSAASEMLLAELPKRSQTILERRFGLRAGQPATLDAIGKTYGITRERVRQIEADAFQKLRKGSAYQRLASLFETLRGYIDRHGGVMAEHVLLPDIAEAPEHPHAHFLLSLARPFQRISEDEAFHNRWHTSADVAGAVEAALKATAVHLARENRVCSKEEVYAIFASQMVSLGKTPEAEHLDSYLKISKLIRANSFDQWGHATSPMIKPRGMRDMAYLVLQRVGKPLHFTEITRLIGDMITKKAAHAQTVHNELIKDKRFVLVGRGMYGMAEWGFEPGIVRDVIVSTLAQKPLSREEIVEQVLAKRQVKENTVLINLQNKRYFKKLPDGRYTSVV